MVFDHISFIKPGVCFEREYKKHNYAPMFRKKFTVDSIGEGKLYVCGLGYAYYYMNGVAVSEDRFTAPVSDYNKTLWYNAYDVTDLLKEGENIIAVWCGNGWYNEEFKTSWDYDAAAWRDLPKFILRLDIDGQTVAVSDESWKCCLDSAVWFNALRSGEYFDARKFDPDWIKPEFDDRDWAQAITDPTPPSGVFRECKCEPIREFETYQPAQITRIGEGKYLFDLGQNISGYIRLAVAGQAGQLLTIRYAEQIKDDMSLQLNQMPEHYKDSMHEFQTDKFICSGEKMVWSPRFTYHGFRYIEIEGLTSLEDVEVCGVFVHQAVEKRSEFECSDEFLNQLFRAGQYSVYANMFYMLTDCPTREKLGWANDAQSSMEQIMTNFKAEKFFEKWLCDVYDAMDEHGALPGIIPTAGWGFAWGNGPVSDGLLFEMPYRIYLHTGNSQPLINSLPFFDRYLDYVRTREDTDGFVDFGLNDWARPGQSKECGAPEVPARFINALLIRNFCRIAALAAELSGKSKAGYLERAEKLKNLVMSVFLDANGRCRINKQTAVAMLIYYDVYEKLEPLKMQLQELVEAKDFHHDCGMVGLRRLYMALNKCGLEEYAYRIITAKGYPGYREWFDQGAVTLWETWDWQDHNDSKNHHMYSDFMSWMVKTILGIRQDKQVPGFQKISVDPYYFEHLTYAKGSCETAAGKIAVFWQKEGEQVRLEVDVPAGVTAFHGDTMLPQGRSVFIEPAAGQKHL